MPNVFHIQLQAQHRKVCEARMSVLGSYLNLFESTYLIYTEFSARQIFEKIAEGLDKPTIIIIKSDISPNAYYGRANKAIWEWITEIQKKMKSK